MAVDRPADDDPERASDGSDSIREIEGERGLNRGDGAPVRAQLAETRTPAEYYRELRAATAAHQTAFNDGKASADARPRTAWDTVDASSRPPLDALRIPPERAIHILEGDATGGGHRYGTGKPGKTEFPKSWNDEKITDSILGVARSPDSAILQKNGRWKVEGVHDEVTVSVIIKGDGCIWSSYPPPGSPGVRQNPRET